MMWRKRLMRGVVVAAIIGRAWSMAYAETTAAKTGKDAWALVEPLVVKAKSPQPVQYTCARTILRDDAMPFMLIQRTTYWVKDHSVRQEVFQAQDEPTTQSPYGGVKSESTVVIRRPDASYECWPDRKQCIKTTPAEIQIPSGAPVSKTFSDPSLEEVAKHTTPYLRVAGVGILDGKEATIIELVRRSGTVYAKLWVWNQTGLVLKEESVNNLWRHELMRASVCRQFVFGDIPGSTFEPPKDAVVEEHPDGLIKSTAAVDFSPARLDRELITQSAEIELNDQDYQLRSEMEEVVGKEPIIFNYVSTAHDVQQAGTQGGIVREGIVIHFNAVSSKTGDYVFEAILGTPRPHGPAQPSLSMGPQKTEVLSLKAGVPSDVAFHFVYVGSKPLLEAVGYRGNLQLTILAKRVNVAVQNTVTPLFPSSITEWQVSIADSGTSPNVATTSQDDDLLPNRIVGEPIYLINPFQTPAAMLSTSAKNEAAGLTQPSH